MKKQRFVLTVFIFVILLSFLGCQSKTLNSVLSDLDEAGYIVEAKSDGYIGLMRQIKPDLSELEDEYSIFSEEDLEVGYLMVFSSHEAAQTYFEEADLGTCIQYNAVHDNLFFNTMDVNVYETILHTTVETTLNITTE